MAASSPRILFVGRSTGHFSYYESVLGALIERGADVELVLDEVWSKRWPGGIDKSPINQFMKRHPGFRLNWLVRRKDRWRDFIFPLRELRSYRSYLVRKHTTPYYIRRWQSYLSPEYRAWTEKPAFRALLRTPVAELGLRAAEQAVPPDPGIVEFLKAKAPDVVAICPMNMRFSEETDYAKAAQSLGIPVAVVVISWDNLSTKGVFQVMPDRVFVWNEYQYEDAIDIQKIPRGRISVSGAPFFDKWFSKSEGLQSREDFCTRLGFDPARPILLYLGSSKNIAKDESWFVKTLAGHLRKSKKPELNSCQILVRPHPANADIFTEMNRPGIRVWPENGALPDTEQAFADMRNSFFHANAAVGINTSGMIDAVLAGLPIFSVRIPRYVETQSDSKHFSYLEQGDALYLVDDLQAFGKGLLGVMTGDDPKAGQRRAFAQRFARPEGLERPAGDVVAEAVIGMAR